jgi:transposase
VNERIKEAITDSLIAHFDETGVRICAKLHWLHVAATEDLTYYLPHEKPINANDGWICHF